MLPRKSGAIVNISSSAAIGPGRGPYTEAVRRGRGGTLYGAEKAALERFTQGLAAEVYADGISVTCVSPSLVVATPGVLHHKLVSSASDPRAEPDSLMADAALLLATEPLDKVTGRVTYSQQILKEFGWIAGGARRGRAAARLGLLADLIGRRSHAAGRVEGLASCARLSFASHSAARKTTAMIECCGFTPRLVGKDARVHHEQPAHVVALRGRADHARRRVARPRTRCRSGARPSGGSRAARRSAARSARPARASEHLAAAAPRPDTPRPRPPRTSCARSARRRA